MSKPQLCQKYKLNEFRKSMLLKALRFLRDIEGDDSLPFLRNFKKWLLQLEMGQVPITTDANSMLLIEQTASIREGLLAR